MHVPLTTLLLATLFYTASAFASQPALSPLAPPPDWSRLDRFQESMSATEFRQLLDHHYAPNHAWQDTITLTDTEASIVTSSGAPPFLLRFRSDDLPPLPFPPDPERTWRIPAELPPLENLDRPLEGIRITLDPGHIGGEWAKMEGRWFQIGNDHPVMEGDMVLIVARLLAERLESLGAEVTHLRTTTEPVTPLRPDDLLEEARALLVQRLGPGARPPSPSEIRRQAEHLFYRNSEIRARAEIVNDTLQPDLVLCLHFNAEAWGNPDRPRLVEINHLHLLINGCYEAWELELEDLRFEMLWRLLGRHHEVETPLARAMIAPMALTTRLPPYAYQGTNAWRLDDAGYLWSRNLLANRIFNAPVIFLEPYIMNSIQDYPRIQAGEYEGQQRMLGRLVPNLYAEYTDAVARGLIAFFRQTRAHQSSYE